MSNNITEEQIVKFREDILTMDVNDYMEFVIPLTKREFRILSILMTHNCCYYGFGTLVKIMNKFYKIKNGGKNNE